MVAVKFDLFSVSLYKALLFKKNKNSLKTATTIVPLKKSIHVRVSNTLVLLIIPSYSIFFYTYMITAIRF